MVSDNSACPQQRLSLPFWWQKLKWFSFCNSRQASCFRITVKNVEIWAKSGEFKDLSSPQKKKWLSGVYGCYYKPTRCNVIQSFWNPKETEQFVKGHVKSFCLSNFGLIILGCTKPEAWCHSLYEDRRLELERVTLTRGMERMQIHYSFFITFLFSKNS